MKHIAIIAVSFALAIPLHAADDAGKAAPKKADPEKVFGKKDKDADGFLSKEEFTAGAKNAAAAETAFGKKDKNSDGKLSKEEFVAMPKGKGKAGEKGKAKEGGDKAKEGGDKEK
jgi:Ca2+-binding EF-hand superfamily protein